MTPTEKQIVDLARRIYALATNPHWTADRRWKIGEHAEEIVKLLVEKGTD